MALLIQGRPLSFREKYVAEFGGVEHVVKGERRPVKGRVGTGNVVPGTIEIDDQPGLRIAPGESSIARVRLQHPPLFRDVEQKPVLLRDFKAEVVVLLISLTAGILAAVNDIRAVDVSAA